MGGGGKAPQVGLVERGGRGGNIPAPFKGAGVYACSVQILVLFSE